MHRAREADQMTSVPTTPPETDLVVLLSDTGQQIGTMSRSDVHSADTPLHAAFSVHLFDDRGRVLLTRRALSKIVWPGVWTNSCCGHPRPGKPLVEAVRRRVREELGCESWDLRVVLPEFRYRAVDSSGIVENEICPVLTGRISPVHLHPAEDEVDSLTWTDWDTLMTLADTLPDLLSPWAVSQVRQMSTVGKPLTGTMS